MDPEEFYFLENSRHLRRLMLNQRSCWVEPILSKRESFGEFHHLHQELEANPKKFFDYYQMMPATFYYILEAIKPRIFKSSNFRETITSEERLSVTLRYLATGESFKTLGYSFRISDVTVGRIVKETCNAIWDTLRLKHMPFPTTLEEIESIKEQFSTRWGFPNCVGCIDGKHVRIRNPCHSGSMYRNYKQFFSIVLQGVVGPNYKFIAIDVGGYGKESDGGVFSNSKISEMLEKGALGSKRVATLPGTNIKVPHVILGDAAYPLKPYLMRPFPGDLSAEQMLFNLRLSRARQVIECTFGIMNSKWRLLQKAIEVDPNFADIIVQCICLLHNVVIDQEGEQQAIQQPLGQQIHSQTREVLTRFASRGENQGTNSAYLVREKFQSYFCDEAVA